MRKTKSKLIYVLLIFLILVIAGAIFFYLEWEDPQIKLAEDFEMIGRQKQISITFTDLKSGIRNYQVSLVQDDQEYTVTEAEFPQMGTFERTVDIDLVPQKLKVKDGEATFIVKVTDFSPLRNSAMIQKKVVIDSIPPKVSLVSTAHYVNPGGSCLAIYTASDDVVLSGVRCADVLFPGNLTKLSDKPCYVCYFAIPMDVQSSTSMSVVVQDKAANESVVEIPFYVRKGKGFRNDTVRISEKFIDRKGAQFQSKDTSLAGKTPLEMFVYINETLRMANAQTIQSICLKSEGQNMWQGAFIRMKNAATMARFGDKRSYTFQGQKIGGSIHLGIDLASTQRAPIQAANSGIVLFADNLGIYGNTVIIDHGQGIASLYAHLNTIKIEKGQHIDKGEIIGNSGATGFAGGDHLHFSMLVNGVFVDPIEWWDPHWIHDNVELKLDQARQAL
ncbi:MAG: M23 family metallopeptidase [Deltaproteobacteria bacterium]|nr:M23 family metallopeptidase [Deltaproteobacteria bacterium]